MSIFGRASEIAEITSMLLSSENAARSIVLTGAGGSGKTTLARGVADNLSADFPDGIFFVELAAVNSADRMISAIAQTLQLKESGGRSLFETVVDFLRGRRALLILDNFEQIIEAASQISELLSEIPSLKILVTSRLSLKIKTHCEFKVLPLDVPPSGRISFDDLNTNPSVRLFDARARTAKSTFVLSEKNIGAVAEICRRLDGLPLAIELAAARVMLLPPQEILDRLEQSLELLTGGSKKLPVHQQTMLGTIIWSYELLEPNEQTLFRRLSVFAGGFTVKAAECVAGTSRSRLLAGDTDPSALDLLTSLTEKNLLYVIEQPDGNVRLRMLEVVREFALEMLREMGDLDDLQRIHAQYFLVIAEEAEPFLEGETGGEWLDRLDKDHDNIRAALSWSLQNDRLTAIRIASGVRHFWINYGHFSEGLRWCESALRATEDSRSEWRLKLLATSGFFQRNQGNLVEARKFHEMGLAESRELNNPLQIAKNNQNLGVISVMQKDYAAARSFYKKALDICHEIKEEIGIAYLLNALGDLEMCQGNLAAARPLLEDCRSRLGLSEDKRLIMTVCNNLGMLDYHEGLYEAATSNFVEVLRIARETNNKIFISYALDGFAAIAGRSENAAQSAKLAGAAEYLRESIGYHIEPAEKTFRETYLSKVRSALNGHSFIAAYENGKILDLNEAVVLAEGSIVELDTEIIIETRKFERITIEES